MDPSRPGLWLSRLLIVSLAIDAAVQLYGVHARLHRASLLRHVTSSLFAPIFSFGAALRADHAAQRAHTMGNIVDGAVAILFIAWLFAMSRAVQQRRPKAQRWAPGWAIGAWFIPLVDIVLPKLVIDDVWKASDSDSTARRRVPIYLHVYWACFVVGFVGLIVADDVSDDTSLLDVDRLVRLERLAALSYLLLAVGAALGAVLVHSLTARVAALPAAAPAAASPTALVFNSPPGWPAPPAGFVPPPGWQPDPSWPAAPANWPFWMPSGG